MIEFSIVDWAAWAPGLSERSQWLGWADAPYPPDGEDTPALAEKKLLANADILLGAVAERDGNLLFLDDGKGGWTLPFVAKTEDDGFDALERHVRALTGLSL